MNPPLRSALLATAFALVAGFGAAPADAVVIGSGTERPAPASSNGIKTDDNSGLRLLKAQMNALQEGLENLEQLKKFFERDRADEETIVQNAERLIKSLPDHENAGEAAWRIAAIATLSSKAGELSSLKINDDYRLPAGAVGWDFGGLETPVHRGFTPITPEIAPGDTTGAMGQPVSGETALTDGIKAPERFQSSLPNGMYRILIVANPERGEEVETDPFGGEITINGSPIGGGALSGSAHIEDRQLGAPESDKLASASGSYLRNTALGLGVESWAIVRDGHLEIDFKGLPAGRAISAVIAEPIDLNRMELTPAVADALSTALTGLAPAAGPDARSRTRRGGAGGAGRSQGGPGSFASAGTGPAVSPVSFRAPAPARKPAPAAKAPSRRTPFIRSFNDIRRNQAAASTPAPETVTDAPQTTETPEPVQAETVEDDFFDRQLLVKHGEEGDNSEGVAIDLGDLLDNGSETGTFLCSETPCDAESFAEITDEPDLSAAATALGDWLSDPENLTEGWDDVVTVLENWEAGSEIAYIYDFDINVDLWTDVELRANVDDGLLVWIDGEFVFGATGPGEFNDEGGYDYRVELPDLEGGSHVIQIVVESRGPDAPAASFELRGTPATNTRQLSGAASVPEPGAAALFGLGLAGLIAFRRRKARA